MMAVEIVHLMIVLGGVAVALGALHWYSRVRGGWLSVAGLLTLALLTVAALLVLAGFGVVSFPGVSA